VPVKVVRASELRARSRPTACQGLAAGRQPIKRRGGGDPRQRAPHRPPPPRPAVLPTPSCPLPLSILQVICAGPAGTPALFSCLIDYDTLEALTRALLTGKSVGTDGIPREFYKYGPRVLRELLRAAFNAFLSGERPTVCEHKWMGAIVARIANQRSALHVTEFRA
jgi:hypothetical protein